MKNFKTVSTFLFLLFLASMPIARAALGGGNVFYKLDSNTTVPAFFRTDVISSTDDFLVAVGKVISIDCQKRAVQYGFDTLEEKWATVALDLEEILASNQTSAAIRTQETVDVVKRGCLMRGQKGEVVGYDGPPPGPIYKKGDRVVVVLQAVSSLSEEKLDQGFPERIVDGAYKLHASYFLPSRSYPSTSQYYAADDRYSDSSPLLQMDYDYFRFAHPFDLKINEANCANKSKIGCADSVGQDLDNWTDRPLISLDEIVKFQSRHSSEIRTDLNGFKRYVNWLLVDGGYQEMRRKIRAMKDSGLAPQVSPQDRY